jgi:hypothetical protein
MEDDLGNCEYMFSEQFLLFLFCNDVRLRRLFRRASFVEKWEKNGVGFKNGFRKIFYGSPIVP